MCLVSHGGCKRKLPPPAPQPGLLVPLTPSPFISVSRSWLRLGGVAEERPSCPWGSHSGGLVAALLSSHWRPAATALPRPMALGPGEMLGSDALLTADTRYLDAFKAETRSGIKPHLPLQPGLCSRQPWEGLGENESWTGRAAITPTRAPALVPEAACLLNTSFRVSAGLSCVYMQKAPHPAQDGVASLGISLPLHP